MEKTELEKKLADLINIELDILNNWEELILTAMGEASMCWSDIDKAGVFDSTRAEQIGKKLLQDIKRRADDSSSAPSQALESPVEA